MKSLDLLPLPLGTSDFSCLREFSQIYVDKTELIYSLASERRKIFLSRPRRFGKSLLISTFESLFRDGLKYFKGLSIEKLWKDQGQYRVVTLDFSRVRSSADEKAFPGVLESYLGSRFSTIGFRKEKNGFLFFDQLELFIQSLPASSLVLLIDEYDAPLTACLNNPEAFHAVRKDLSTFYSILKANDKRLRFLFLTGITKFSKSSIFSELNNIEDISFLSRYGNILGYTEAEIRAYFGGYLRESASSLNLSEAALLEHLKDHYDGFCFDAKVSSRVFNPWSTLSFFNRPEEGFRNYWFESGGKTRALLEYFKSHILKSPLNYSDEKTIDLQDLSLSSDLESLSDLALLAQSGYLTIKKVADDETVYLGYPNREVSQSMAKLYTEMLLQGRTLDQAGAGGMAECLRSGPPESVFQCFNRLFLSMDQQRYPVRLESEIQRLVQVFLAGAGLDPRVETVNAFGRSDLEVTAGSRHWVLEFKVCREGGSEERLLQEAVEQIRSRRYGEGRGGRDLVRLALVFSVEERQFVRWGLCPEA